MFINEPIFLRLSGFAACTTHFIHPHWSDHLLIRENFSFLSAAQQCEWVQLSRALILQLWEGSITNGVGYFYLKYSHKEIQKQDIIKLESAVYGFRCLFTARNTRVSQFLLKEKFYERLQCGWRDLIKLARKDFSVSKQKFISNKLNNNARMSHFNIKQFLVLMNESGAMWKW